MCQCGYIDKLQGDVYSGRATDRLFISGWAASTRAEFPVEEVRIIAGGKLCASFKHFYPRPEVATIFNRSEFIETGYRGLVFLPILKPGMHELTAIARDSSGMEQELHSLQLHITE